ncbi:HEAT repeat protein [Maioricimonas rarisocia]|uniref:HEAT repeat protein n=1 Tax=Maioricimonas rarisocia TaxID=2528026 RepID=A0A517ZEV1_9PLAN|nr:HEAT repeat domain-containing protein [Maioricimonas rarisocia]QDU40986.1 HEAT repeat protein [Maioricimonas rarisocia]
MNDASPGTVNSPESSTPAPKKSGNRIGLLLIGLLVVAAAVVWLEPTRVGWGLVTGEAFYEGRPTSYWRNALAGPADARAEAEAALQNGGNEAVPVLTELAAGKAGDDWKGSEVRILALDMLGAIGPDASEAIPVVTAALEDEDGHLRSVAAVNLPKIGAEAEQAVPALTKLAAMDPRPEVIRAISVYREEAASSLPVLVKILEDHAHDTETRWNAARTLGKLGPRGVQAVEVLVRCLKDEESTVREHSAEALGDIGPPAVTTVPDLVSVLDDPATRVRRDAVRSLGQVGPEAKAAVPQIVPLLDDPEQMVRDATATTLEILAPDVLEEHRRKKAEEENAEDEQAADAGGEG